MKMITILLIGSFLLLLIIILLLLNGTSDNIWGLITLLSAAPGSYFFGWSITKIPGMLKANAILEENFTPNFDKEDLVLHSELRIPSIGTFIYEHILFVINKSWYYSVPLSDVEWLFVISMSSNVTTEDVLVVNTVNKKRYYFSLPEISSSGKYKWVSTSENIKYIEYLHEYILANYPDIDLGYSWEKDVVFLKDKTFLRKIFEKLAGHGKHKKWAELNRKYNSMAPEHDKMLPPLY